MKFFLSAIFALLLFYPATAQSQIPGYVVTLSGDTLRGSFDAKDLRKGYLTCKFQDSKSRIETFSAGEIRGYGTDSVHYESWTVKNQPGAVRTFYKVLFRGDISLYSGDEKKLYVGADSLANIFALTNRNMLYYLTARLPGMKEKITDTKLRSEALMKLFAEIHSVAGAVDYVIYAPAEKPSTKSLYVSAGYSVGSLSTWTVVRSRGGNLDVAGTSSVPVFAFGVEYFPAGRNKQVVSMIAELTARSEKIKLESNEYFSTVHYQEVITYTGTVVSGVLGLKTRFIKRPWANFYAVPGVSYNFILNREGNYKRWDHREALNETILRYDEPQEHYAKAYPGLWAAVGAEKKIIGHRWFTEVRYEGEASYRISLHRWVFRLGMNF